MIMPPSDGAAGTIVAGTPTLGTFTVKVPAILASRQFSLTIQP